MSQRPIAHSDDLRRLRAEGYTLAICSGKLVVRDIPFVDRDRAVHDDGALVMPLTLTGETTTTPSNHTAHFVGGVPCDTDGRPLHKILNNTNQVELGDGLVASCYFSAKPVGKGKYPDFYEKVTSYVGHISGPATALNGDVTPKRWRPVPTTDDHGPFKYVNTASSRAGIDSITEKLTNERIAIVGLGGTGEYVLDFVAKTPVAEVHIFDDDRFYSHNAFRAPGAPSFQELEAAPLKVDHFKALYSNMHGGVVAHPYRIDAANVDELRSMTFVFICIDDAPSKKPIIAALENYDIPFVDVGMGVQEVDGRLTGVVRTTTSTPEKRDHLVERVPFSDAGIEDDYRSNIQIVELNAYNASAAVVRWKKYRGFYADLGHEHHTTYSITTNHFVNEDRT